MSDTAGESTAICVLGMSRSGTSLTARVLSMAGVYLGREEELLQGELHQLGEEGESVLATARAANPGGFWEHYELMRLNERILRRLGGNWREPPALEPGWERSELLEAEREEARALLAASFGGRELWGWKDPRNSLTLPFWQDLLPRLHYVVCLRNPLDVARSLARRDGMSIEQGVALWLVYVERALANTESGPRVFIPYELYFERPLDLARRLAHFAGRSDAFDGPDAVQPLLDAVDGGLWRQRGGSAESLRDPRVPAEAAALYQATERLAAAGTPDE